MTLLELARSLLELTGEDVMQEVLRIKRAGGCVDEIRDFVDRIGTPGITVCSRIQEYEALRDRLKLGGAITLQPLRSEQVHDYLERIGDRLKGLWTAIENDELRRHSPSADETTICKFRHLMERHNLGDQLFHLVNQYFQENGLKVNRGTIVDASIM